MPRRRNESIGSVMNDLPYIVEYLPAEVQEVQCVVSQGSFNIPIPDPSSTVTCYKCGKRLSSNNAIPYYGYIANCQYLCRDCNNDDNFAICPRCSGKFLEKDICEIFLYDLVHTITVCPSCYISFYTHFYRITYCQICGKLSYNNINNRHDMCPDCIRAHKEFFFPCNECGKLVSTIPLTLKIDNHSYNYTINADAYIVDDIIYCEKCYYDKFIRCDICNNEVLKELSCNQLCLSCYEKQVKKIAIYNWGFKPIPIFHQCPNEKFNNNKVPLYLGFELEVENDKDDDDSSSNLNSKAKDILSKFSNNKELFYCKYDSSIEYGFEIVTHPMTLKAHEENEMWEKLLSYLMRNGYYADTKGLHIHASRNFLSQYIEQIKLGIFVNLQKKRMVIIATRETVYQARFKPIKISNHHDTDYKYANMNVCGDRHSAINWDNDNTIEFRIFRGSLDLDYIIVRLQLVDACMRFVKTISVPEIIKKDYSWNKFIDFIRRYKKDYWKLENHLRALDLAN